ncbi:TIGR03986 family type III CRISPR-associated RAMP protein [Dolichospermum heterosporum]|uniref:TIGR03986 family CRISPR-associated RAMP protein n=1 Tax=Dolichospermum heterosporum TAC447 TaxID=747523 RepID=A0ABY5LUZ1_9CYAN|nr:TIGR03986 family CRISPR-associated RAMP protein [Dolichospermum heterosporum]UUO15802.1 TIGR03986 family CRISPR-associated RAMP protein [Dolichospermum heterosporum TAC447]
MNPKHITPKSKNNRAFAPYNFVELPSENKLVTAQKLPNSNCYDKERYTGYIECTLVTETPLYIRSGLIPDDFKNFGDLSCNHQELEQVTSEEQKRWTDFFNNPANNRPIIPGSSIRGMLRTIMEIVTYSKFHQVSGNQKLFFRAVAAPKLDPLTEEYNKKLLDQEKNQVKAGYLQQQKEGSWRIYIAQDIEKHPFIWIKESLIPDDIELIKLNKTDYKPQYLEVKFDEITHYKTRYLAKQISKDNPNHKYRGYLVTSGNMIEGNKGDKSPRQYHCLIGGKTNDYIEIDHGAVEDYLAGLTEFQKKYFDENSGILKNDYPVFFIEPRQNEKVTLFGHSPNFRVPYTPPSNNGRAASVTDFIPSRLKSAENSDIDMTEAIFGWVNKKSQDQARAGRIFITDAIVDDAISEDEIWCQQNPNARITPPILATPKPTTFQHYLVQTDIDGKRENLNHYGSVPNQDTVIRGYKLYWHQKDVSSSSIRESNEEEISNKPKQYTKIRPINSKVSFHFKIYFDNLTDEELGALLWILDLAKEKESRIYVKDDQEYRFSLGMGKPFGMGAVKLTNQQLYLSQRQEKRYQKLFNGNNWETGNYNDTEIEAEVFVESFKNYLLDENKIGENSDGNLEDVNRIKMLLEMLSFPGKSKGSVRYMQIEHPRNNNEYDQRPVLPNPSDV